MGWSRIRLYSRIAALAVAAIAVLAASALRVQRTPEHFGSLSITSYIVTAPEPHRETPPRKPPPTEPARAVAAAFIGPSSAPPPARLWSYSADGQIVFDHLEQYRRCVAARAARHNEADCPEPHDPHPLVLRSSWAGP